jgi:hypothetical protein
MLYTEFGMTGISNGGGLGSGTLAHSLRTCQFARPELVLFRKSRFLESHPLRVLHRNKLWHTRVYFLGALCVCCLLGVALQSLNPYENPRDNTLPVILYGLQ